jgi:CHAT domain-containing protein
MQSKTSVRENSRSSSVRPMSRRRLILLLTIVYVSLSASATQAQIDDVLAREGDEGATTTEARQSALTTLLAAAGEARQLNDPLKAARFLNRAGRLQLKLGLPEKALATYGDARALLEGTTPDPTTNIDSLNGVGAAYNHSGKCSRARPFLRRAITLSVQTGYVAGRAEALLTLSTCQNLSNHALAIDTAREALSLWESVNNRRGIAQTYSAIGDYQLAQSNVTEATQSHEAALKIWTELDVANERAEALINLGFVEYRKGAWQNIFKFLSEAQGLLDEKAEPYKMGQITGCLAEALIESGMPDAGLTKLLQALEYYRLAQNEAAVTAVVWAIGKTHYHLGHYAEALENLRSALTDAESIGDRTVAALCNDFLGRTFWAMKDDASALHYFEVAFDLYNKVGNPMEAARALALMGQVYQRQGKVAKAKSYYRRALETFRALSDHINESATLYALGSLELKLNNLSLAQDYLSQSITATENIRRASTSRDLTTAFSATVYERYEKYIECLMRQHETQPERGFVLKAFETYERARAPSLIELLRATQTNLIPGLDPKLAEQENSLRQALKVKEDSIVTLLSGAYKKEELAALKAEIARLEAEYKQVAEAIQAQHPLYERITRPAAWDLRRIQEQVIADDQTVLLEFLLGADRSYVWAVTRDSIRSYELPSRSLINEAATKAYNSLSTRPGADATGTPTLETRELSQLILSPVAAELNKRHVIIVADGDLNYIPFQVLPMPSDVNETFVDNHEITNAHSASILGELQQEAARRQPAAKVLAAFGNPAFEPNYTQSGVANGGEQLATMQGPEAERGRYAVRDLELNGDTFDPAVIKPLVYAKRELANLVEITAGEETFVATDYAATREQLLKTDLTQYAIIHFATHGWLDPKQPENSCLVLSTVDPDGRARDGFVRLQNIYELRVPVKLVVLSACRTALGKDVRGEGLMSLTYGFMYAGASSVVASLWKVDDEATAELMKQFYNNMLHDGMTPSEALRAAQNSIRQRPEWRSPYYWAAFTLQGEYRQIIRPAHAATSTTLYWRVGLCVALLMLAGGLIRYSYRRRRRRPLTT